MRSEAGNRPSSHESAQRTRAYFESVYPARQAGTRRGWARAGEDQRISVVREWLRDCPGTDVLDVGCGDGFFLAAVVPSWARRIRVEDLVPARVAEAAKRVEAADRTVEAAVADINLPTSDGGTFDVVLAIGVTDYNPDWDTIVANLCRRTRGTLIVDFPSAGGLRTVARKLWLRSHGVALRSTTLSELRPLLAVRAEDTSIVNLGLNWVVRMTPSATPALTRANQITPVNQSTRS